MRILFLAHSFNSLTQRLYVELTEAEHEISIEFDVNDRVTVEAAALFAPDLPETRDSGGRVATLPLDRHSPRHPRRSGSFGT